MNQLLNRIEDSQSEAKLRSKVRVGFALAIILTSSLGILSWRMAQQATGDADWVVHTHEVSTTLEAALRHLLDVESGGRGFAVTGSEPFLEPYEAGKSAVAQDLLRLRSLILDPNQQRRLEALEKQANVRIESVTNVVTVRQNTGQPPTKAQFERGRQLMNAARATIAEMENAEKHLLEQRRRRARTAQRFNLSLIGLGALAGLTFLSLAGATVSREIAISARARAQVVSLNADLERRVEQRTAALGESEGRLAGVIQSAMDAIIAVDEQQRIVMFNCAAESMFRCPASEALGQPITRFIPERFRAAHMGHHQRFHESGATRRVMGRLGVLAALRADGTEFPVEIAISQVEAAGRKIFTAVVRDVSERQQAEEALRESEQRYRLLFSEMQAGFALFEVIYDKNGKPCDHRYLDVNPAHEVHTGLPREKVLGKTIREAFPGIEPFWIENYSKVATTGESVHFENYAQPLQKWIEGAAFRTHAGHLAVTFADITLRKQAEEVRERLAAIVEASDDAIISKTLDGTITAWNHGAEKIFGYSAAQAMGQAMLILFPPERVNEESDILARIRRGESVEHFETSRVRKDGARIDVSVTISPIRDGNGAVIGASKIARDITQKKAAELEIRRLNESLEERIAERTAQLESANHELEAFTYSVSHDLRAPLRHIQGFAGACLEEFGTSVDPQALHYLQRIQDGTHRMGLLINELLNLARTGRRTLSLQLTGLNSVAEEIISMLKAETEGRNVEWKVGNLPSVECDPVLVRQIFQNLLSNAIKYSRPRSHAIIEIGHTQEKNRPVIFVRDNGVGFNMKYANKLFGVFQRLHRDEDFEGTGVGLATVQRIVRKHGGRIWAEAELDRGATFYFTLGSSEIARSRSDAATAGG